MKAYKETASNIQYIPCNKKDGLGDTWMLHTELEGDTYTLAAVKAELDYTNNGKPAKAKTYLSYIYKNGEVVRGASRITMDAWFPKKSELTMLAKEFKSDWAGYNPEATMKNKAKAA